VCTYYKYYVRELVNVKINERINKNMKKLKTIGLMITLAMSLMVTKVQSSIHIHSNSCIQQGLYTWNAVNHFTDPNTYETTYLTYSYNCFDGWYNTITVYDEYMSQISFDEDNLDPRMWGIDIRIGNYNYEWYYANNPFPFHWQETGICHFWRTYSCPAPDSNIYVKFTGKGKLWYNNQENVPTSTVVTDTSSTLTLWGGSFYQWVPAPTPPTNHGYGEESENTSTFYHIFNVISNPID